jgi:hypothetical protein
MIVKEYYQSVNVTDPKNYFENWYADVWQRRVRKPTVEPDLLRKILIEEFEKVGALVEYSQYSKFKVAFINDTDYTVFMLKWS